MKKIFCICVLTLSLAAEAATDIRRWTTRSGTQVLLVEQHDNPIVDVQISFKGAGSVFNPQDKSEVAEFTSALLTDGTQDLDEEAFNAAADDIAVRIGSSSGKESAAVSLRSLSRPEILDKAAVLVNRSLTHPRFNTAVFERRQKQAVASLGQREADPGYIAARELIRLAYGDHPYGSSARISAESIKRVGTDDLGSFHRSRYGKNNAVVAIVGDISRKQADKLVGRLLDGLPERVGSSEAVKPVAQKAAERRDIPFAGEQVQIMLGMPLITRKDPDYYALVAGNYILGGGGFDSRLMKELRDRHGYTYGVHSSLEPATEAGMFTVSYSTQKKNAQESLARAQEVIRRFVAEGPTEEELVQAKANIAGGFPLRYDTNDKLVKYLGIIGFHNLPDDYLSAYPKAISGLTVDEVREVWRRRVNPDDLHIVVVGAQNTRPAPKR